MPNPDNASHDRDRLQQAKALHRSGRREEAATIYRDVLAANPENAEAHRLLGVVLLENGKLNQAQHLLKKAQWLAPESPAVLNNLGSLSQAKGKPGDAEALFRSALMLEPKFVPAMCNLANLYQQQYKLPEAAELYQDALKVEPDTAALWNNLGNLHSRLGRYEHAHQLISHALQLEPDYAEAHANLGLCSFELGHYALALERGLHSLGLRPGHAATLNNCGNALLKLNRSGEALTMFRAALRADKALAEAANGAGLACRMEGRPAEAIRYLRRALAIKPDYAAAWNNLGLANADAGLAGEALSAYRQALALNPGYQSCHSNLLFCMNYQDDINPRALAEAHENWGIMHQHYADEWQVPALHYDGDRPLRVGFVSADFCRHPVAYFLLPVVRGLRERGFDCHAYSGTSVVDDMTSALKAEMLTWQQVSGLDDKQLCERIRDDHIDILFDLSGHTSGNRLRCFSLRPAPLQLSWLGYPHSTGLETIDYIVSDALSLPAHLHWQFSEKVLHLPSVKCCYEPPDYAPPVSALPADSKASITFGSFNNPVKLSDRTLALWAAVMQKVTGSRLVLSWKSLDDPTVAERLKDRFEAQGISASRLVLLGGKRQHETVLGDYAEVDIALDTWPFSGGVTSCEALWMGVPVVTLAGKLPASRQTAGFLGALLLDELVCFTPEDFAECASKLASNRDKLRALRRTLRARMQASPLCHQSLFCDELADTLRSLALEHAEQRRDDPTPAL